MTSTIDSTDAASKPSIDSRKELKANKESDDNKTQQDSVANKEEAQERKKIFINQIKSKDEIESTFYLKYCGINSAKDGRSFMTLVLCDSTGELDARIWHDVELHAKNVDKGDFVNVKGRLNLFQGRKQFVISHIEKVDPESIKESDYWMSSGIRPDVMYTDLLKIVESLDEVYIRDLLLLILKDNEVKRRLQIWQAGKSIHHAYRSGLLEHILSCVQLAQFLSKQYKVNESYVVAGAILHDLAKIYELSSGIQTEYTEEGKLVGHLSKGSELIDRFSYRIRNFPYNLKLHLKHIILSHHGSYEFGSPKLPQTLEANLVHLIDFMDSKMNGIETVIKADTNPGHWTNYHKGMDRVFYKGSLPSYKEYLPETDSTHSQVPNRERNQDRSNEGERKPSNKSYRSGKPKQEKELKQNLGKLFSNIKIN